MSQRLCLLLSVKASSLGGAVPLAPSQTCGHLCQATTFQRHVNCSTPVHTSRMHNNTPSKSTESMRSCTVKMKHIYQKGKTDPTRWQLRSERIAPRTLPRASKIPIAGLHTPASFVLGQHRRRRARESLPASPSSLSSAPRRRVTLWPENPTFSLGARTR